MSIAKRPSGHCHIQSKAKPVKKDALCLCCWAIKELLGRSSQHMLSNVLLGLQATGGGQSWGTVWSAGDELWDSGEQGNQVGNLMPCRGGVTLLQLIVDLGVCAWVARSNHFPGVAGTPCIFQLRIYQLSYPRRKEM